MDPSTITTIWLIAGIVLMLGELILPGLVVIFLGLGAMLVALLRYIGIITSDITSFTAWFILSLLLILLLRWVFLRIFPPDSYYTATKEDEDATGTTVEVTNTINSHNTEGRIRFRGSTWPAICQNGEIPSGKQARLLYRDNLSWVVEEVSHWEEGED